MGSPSAPPVPPPSRCRRITRDAEDHLIMRDAEEHLRCPGHRPGHRRPKSPQASIPVINEALVSEVSWPSGSTTDQVQKDNSRPARRAGAPDFGSIGFAGPSSAASGGAGGLSSQSLLGAARPWLGHGYPDSSEPFLSRKGSLNPFCLIMPPRAQPFLLSPFCPVMPGGASMALSRIASACCSKARRRNLGRLVERLWHRSGQRREHEGWIRS